MRSQSHAAGSRITLATTSTYHGLIAAPGTTLVMHDYLSAMGTLFAENLKKINFIGATSQNKGLRSHVATEKGASDADA
jgi:hypothetical protein